MRGEDDALAARPREPVEQARQRRELLRRIDVLLAMAAHHEIPLRLEPQPRQHVGTFNRRQVVLQHFPHRTARGDHPIGRKAFAQQILARDRRVRQVHVGEMIDHAPVDLLRHPLVERSIARLHVKHRNAQPLRRQRGEAAVGVAEHEQRAGPPLAQQPIHGDDHLSDRLGRGRARRVERDVGRADAELAEEDAVELVAVVLSGVDEEVVGRLIEPGDDAGQPDQLGPRPHDRHDSEP